MLGVISVSLGVLVLPWFVLNDGVTTVDGSTYFQIYGSGTNWALAAVLSAAILGSARLPESWPGVVGAFLAVGQGWLYLDRARRWLDREIPGSTAIADIGDGPAAALWGSLFLLIAAGLTWAAA